MDKQQIVINIGNGVSPRLPTFDETIEFVKQRREVFALINGYLSNQERWFSEHSGLRPVAYQTNLAKAANSINHIPLEHVVSGNMLINSIIGASYLGIHDGNIQRLHRSVQDESFQEQMAGLSAFAALPSWLKNAVYHIPESVVNDSNTAVMRYYTKCLCKHIGVIWTMEIHQQLLGMAHSEFSEFIKKNANTKHPFIFVSMETSEYKWCSGLAAFHILATSLNWNVHRTLLMVKKFRKSLKEINAKQESKTKGLTIEKVLWKLSDVRPGSWKSDNSIGGFLAGYAEKRFPAGSLVGIEIEFVGNYASPFARHLEDCNDCEGCENGDGCHNPVNTQSVQWLEKPFVWFKHDGSISATSDNQVVLPYQEMNVVANIHDSKDFSRVTEVLNWMNKNKFEVNKTCGLHVHLDSRHCTPNMFTRKANRMEEAMIKWIQFCVPFSRASNSYCKVFSGNRGDRYKAVNRTSFNKYQTLEIRIGSASLNPTKVANWAKLLHYCFTTREDISTIDNFLKTDASPEIKAFAISRIVRFYQSHLSGRNTENNGIDPSWTTKGNERNIIPQEIHDIYNTWNEVISVEGNNA